MKSLHFSVVALSAALLVIFSPAQAQENKPDTIVVTAPVVVDKGPEDALNRGNPRSMVIGFLTAASAFNWEKAAEYLDLRNLPPEVSELGGPELARELNHILSRAVWLDDYSVSESPEGIKGDDLPDYRDELVRIITPDGEVPIWLQRVPRADGVKIWKLSNRSVALIPDLYDEFSYPPTIERIRNWFPQDAAFLGIELFKWFIVLVFAVIVWPFYYLFGWLLSRLFSAPGREIYPLVKKVFTGPLVLIAILITTETVVTELGVGAGAQGLMEAQTINILAVIWVSWAIINLIKKYQQNKLIALERPGAAKLMQPMTTLIKILVTIFGLLFWLNNIGVNITTVLAGLGVGGLAVALALQKPIEDMMGALAIFSQAPIRVGDLCKVGTVLGNVEDIGLRTTRIRTLTNTVVSIPNSLLAAGDIENLSYRTKIRYWPTLRLRYDTTADQIRDASSNILAMLTEHDRVYDKPLRVRFTDFDDDAILIKVHSFLKTTDFTESLEIGEDLNLRVMEIVQAAGARFALPGKSIYLEGEVPVTRV
jgi:MscS family membrane protein